MNRECGAIFGSGRHASAWRPRVAAIVVAGLLACAGAAQAQRLNMSSSELPTASVAIRGLNDRIATLQSEGDPAKPTITSGLARLASRLAAMATLDGPDAGAAYVLAARILDSTKLIETSGTPLWREILARDLAAIDTAPITTLEGFERALRGALAPIVEEEGYEPWIEQDAGGLPNPAGSAIETGGTLADPIGDVPGTSAESLAALRAFVVAAWEWPAHRGTARRIVQGLREIVRAQGDRTTITGNAGERFNEELARCVEELAQPATRRMGLDRLDRLAALARVVLILPELGNEAGARPLRQKIGPLIATLPDLTGPEGGAGAGDDPATRAASDPRTLAQIERWLRQAAGRAMLADESAVVRQIRPALRTLSEAARETEADLLNALANAIAAPGATRQPAVLAAAAAHQRGLADLVLLVRASRTIEATAVEAAPAPSSSPVPGEMNSTDQRGVQSPPAANQERSVREDAALLATRLLDLSRDVPNVRRREAALPALRELSARIIAAGKLRGEEGLRLAAAGEARGAEWNLAAGGRAGELMTAVDAHRTRFQNALRQRDSDAADSAASSLLAADAITGLIEDRLEVLRIGRASGRGLPGVPDPFDDTINSWPGWRMSGAALERAAFSLESEIARLLEQFLASPQIAMEGAQLAGPRLAVVRLAARLSREHRSALVRGGAEVTDGLAMRVRVLAAGPPDPARSWMARYRARIGRVCAFAEAAAAAEKDAAIELDAYAAELASDLLTDLERERSLRP